MIEKIKGVFSDSFIRSSLLFSIVNLLASAIAYIIIILVSRRGGELINSWTALNNLVTIFLTFTAGFSLYYSKRISRIAHKNKADTDIYLVESENFLKKTALKYGWIFFAVALGLAAVLKFLTWYQAVLIIAGVFFELWAILYRMYFLGRLEYNQAMILTFASAVARFVGIVGLLYLGFGINSLVIGNLFGSLISVVISKMFVRLNPVASVKTEYNIAHDFVASIQASGALIMSSVLLQAGQVITQGLYHTENKAVPTIITMVNIFGSMIFYGASAFLSLFVVNATRSASQTIYRKALLIISGVSILGIAAIAALWNPAVKVLGRTEYTPYLKYFLLYSVFMLLYNLFFVSIQFMVSQYQYKHILKISAVVFITIAALVVNVYIPGNNYIVRYFSVLIIGALLSSAGSFYLITKDREKA